MKWLDQAFDFHTVFSISQGRAVGRWRGRHTALRGGRAVRRSGARSPAMQRSSNKIGPLAAALAKAQSETANPEKSLSATIESSFPRQGSERFATHPYQPVSTSFANALASMRLLPFKVPRLIETPA